MLTFPSTLTVTFEKETLYDNYFKVRCFKIFWCCTPVPWVSNYYKQTSLNIFYSRKVWDMIGTSAL